MKMFSLYSVFPVSKKENGIVCPACFSDNGTICTPQPLKCTGAETKCVKVTGKGMEISQAFWVILLMGTRCQPSIAVYLIKPKLNSLRGHLSPRDLQVAGLRGS